MARQNHGPLSRAKGKLGGIVYQQYEGMQISREYQPVVKNPQTSKQVTNRAKFKLSSQIVAQYQEVLNARLGSLAIYTRMRRAAAVNAIYGVIDDGTPNSPQALVNSVVAAINAKSVSATPSPEFTDSGTKVFVDIAQGDTLVYVACSYDATKGDLLARDTKVVNDQFGTYEVATKDATRKIIMAVFLRPTSDAGRAVISNVSANATAWKNEIARSVAAGDIEISNMGGYVLEPNA